MLASTLGLGACATNNNFDAAVADARTRAPQAVPYTSPYNTQNVVVGPNRYERPINAPIMMWGFNNYANARPIEGCWLVQDFIGVDPDGRERQVRRVVGALPHQPEAICRASTAINGTIRDTGQAIGRPFQQYERRP